MGDPSGEGLQTRADINPISEVPIRASKKEEPPLNRKRDTETCHQGHSKEGYLPSRPIPQPNFPGPQERQVSKVGDQPETPESVRTAHFKMESLVMMRDLQLDGLHRFKRCVPVGCNMGRSPEVSEIPMERQHIRVSVSSNWSEQCTTCLHQVTHACTCKTPLARNESTVQGKTGKTPSPNNNSPRTVRVRDQQRKIPSEANPTDTTSQLYGGLQGDEDQVLRGKGGAHCDNLQENQGETFRISERTGQINC